MDIVAIVYQVAFIKNILMSKQTLAILMLAMISLFLLGCAPGPNVNLNTSGVDGNVAGFWRGLWHGCICPITFVISLFSDSVSFYEVHNNGGWYDFGFLLGVGMIFACR